MNVRRGIAIAVAHAACVLGLILGFAWPATVVAQAEEKEPTLAEAKAAFAKADQALNQAWNEIKGVYSGRALNELTASQREWVEFRDERAKRESQQAGEKAAKRSTSWHTTAAYLTESRAEWLFGRARAPKDEAKTLTGKWIDSYGGTMELVHQLTAATEGSGSPSGRLLFLIEVVRGPTYHLGGVAGVASWNERVGWWSDKAKDPEKTDESNLVFVERDGCIEVIGANTSHYHGARAYFDGIYCKVGALDEKAQAEVIKAAESGEIPEPVEDGNGDG